MKKIMFNERYGLETAVLHGTKDMTRRIIKGVYEDVKAYHANGGWHFIAEIDGESFELKPTYEIGETIAIAQKYWDLRNCDAFYDALKKADPTFPLECISGEKGCYNKMFVKADWMPHQIQITNIKAERLRSISEEECMREGVEKWIDSYIVPGIMENRGHNNKCFNTPKAAFHALITKISGKNVWKYNPFVFAYTFRLIK